MGKKIAYPEHERAIYLWKLNDDGSLKKYVINEYRETTYHYHGSSIQYMFKIGNETTPRCIKDTQLDRFLNGRVCSFDGNEKKARKIIDDTLSAKVTKYKDDYDSAIELLTNFRRQA